MRFDFCNPGIPDRQLSALSFAGPGGSGNKILKILEKKREKRTEEVRFSVPQKAVKYESEEIRNKQSGKKIRLDIRNLFGSPGVFIVTA